MFFKKEEPVVEKKTIKPRKRIRGLLLAGTAAACYASAMSAALPNKHDEFWIKESARNEERAKLIWPFVAVAIAAQGTTTMMDATNSPSRARTMLAALEAGASAGIFKSSATESMKPGMRKLGFISNTTVASTLALASII